MVAELTQAALDAGRTGVRSFFQTRPPIAEEESVHRVLCLAELTGAPVYLVHLSTSGALDHVRAARRRGVSAWAEAVTWGLILDDSVIDREDPRAYMAAPPPRPRAHVEAVWAAVADGTLDTLGSDHHERTYAPPDAPDFTGIPYSIRGIRVRLPMLLAEGLRRGIPMQRMAPCSPPVRPGPSVCRPRGRCSRAPTPTSRSGTPTAAGRSATTIPPGGAMTVPGAVRTVLRRGELMVHDGALVGSRSAGRHLRRERAGS